MLRKIWRWLLAWRTDMVRFRRESLADLPPIRDLAPLEIIEMNPADPNHVADWLRIMNRSFDANWTVDDFRTRILEHPHYEVPHTYFLLDGARRISAVSEAYYHRAPEVGVTHYLGLDREYLGRGLGKQMILHTLIRMAERGRATSCEGETNLDHVTSILLHFSLGFRPKLTEDPWNTPDPAPRLKRFLTRRRYLRLWQQSWARISHSTRAIRDSSDERSVPARSPSDASGRTGEKP